MRTLKKALTKINFTPENGLVFCDKPEETECIVERYHIQEKANKLEATAVLFRRKYENDKITDSKPVLYIYNEIDELRLNSDKHEKLHAKIWSAGEIDVYFIVSDTTIDIFNARKPAEVQKNGKQELNLENLRLVSEALEQFNDKRFSAMVFGKGIFWEQEDFFNDNIDNPFFRNRLKEENAPFYQLLEYLMAVREYLKANSTGLLPETIDKLLIVCLLVKFLEEIKDDKGKHTLGTIYKKHRVKSFAEALEKRICISILKELSHEFNGDIFDKFSDEEKQHIEQTNLKLVADFLRAKLDIPTRQYFLWEQYNFNHLPVELISSIYENFLPKEKGVVYTPPFLVNALIDEVMPLDKAETYFSRSQFKVLDPSCGSGVFLVAAYKRMLQWWSVNRYKRKQPIEFPAKEVCQKILEDNIFGVDINPTATLISIFSLTIALLDKLEPKEIWNNLKLNSLRDNIQTRDFFEWAVENKDKKFDLVIGNPPFNPMSGIKKKDAVSESQIQQFGISNKDIPNNNFALKFFEGAMFFAEKTCLVLPSNVLLYNKSKSAQKYRNRIFTKFTVEKIFDFTHLRRELFGSVDTPVCVVLANPSESKEQKIEHTVIKRITAIEKKIAFEIDHYDRHFVPHDWATDEKKQFVWKTNLLGGGRLFHSIYRLSLLEYLKQFIEERKKENNEWIFQDGYKNISEVPILSKDEKKGGIVPYIYNRNKVSFIKDGKIISNKIEIHKYFGRPRPENLYKLPLLIIHKKIGNGSLPVGIKKIHTDDYLVFNSSFVGIHAPKKEFRTLEKIYHRLKEYSHTYFLWILATSPSAMIGQETAIKKTELDTLPFPDDEEYLELSEIENILQEDVLEYYIHLGKAISRRGQGRKLHEKVSQKQLEKFGQIFCDTLNPIYAKNGKSWQCGKFSQTQLFTICQFGYGKNKGLSFQMFDEDELDDIIKSLIYNNASNRGIIFTRVCRIYKHMNGYDCVFLIKPHAIRYWLNSIALRDADETFIDLKKAGR